MRPGRDARHRWLKFRQFERLIGTDVADSSRYSAGFHRRDGGRHFDPLQLCALDLQQSAGEARAAATQ